MVSNHPVGIKLPEFWRLQSHFVGIKLPYVMVSNHLVGIKLTEFWCLVSKPYIVVSKHHILWCLSTWLVFNYQNLFVSIRFDGIKLPEFFESNCQVMVVIERASIFLVSTRGAALIAMSLSYYVFDGNHHEAKN